MTATKDSGPYTKNPLLFSANTRIFHAQIIVHRYCACHCFSLEIFQKQRQDAPCIRESVEPISETSTDEI